MNNSNNTLSAYCRNILIATAGLEYYEPYLIPDTSIVKSASITQPSNGEELFTEKNIFLNIYPNPAIKYLVIEYNLSNKWTSTIASITNISGIVIETIKLNPSKSQKVLDLRKYTTGTYLISIISNAKVLEAKKFVKY